MADRIITAEALITAKDGTGDVFTKIAGKFQQLGKGAKVSAEIERMNHTLEQSKKQLAALDKLQSSRTGFAEARAKFRAQQAAVEAAARAMKQAEKPTRELQAAYQRAQAAVSRTASAFEKSKAAMIDAKRAAEGFGAPLSKIAAQQNHLRSAIESTTRAIEHQGHAELKSAEAAIKSAAAQKKAEHAAEHRAKHGFGGGLVHGAGHATGATALIGGYGVIQGVEKAAETYREFDKERRYAKAVMGITDEQQEPLIRQAIEGGAKSKYNDIQWLEAQRELAARGLKVDQVRALAEVSSTIGQAMDKSLPDASKALEGGMFGFGKDTSTYEKAVANARRTADLQVKASKISGMSYEDIVAAYKYAATPFKIAGLSEEQMLAFAAVGKKANMPGDEMGTAGRALVANLLKPTAGARTAMMANGIDYSKYQNQGTKPMDVESFSKSIAASYGVALDEKAKAALQKTFNDKAIVGDSSKFMPAIMSVLSDNLGGDDAKAKKSIAGEARRYRDASMGGVDAPKLFNDLMMAIAHNPTLANAVFGSKQGARIGTAIGSPDVYAHKLDELQNHSQGYAQQVSDARMAGFDGALSKLTNSLLNVYTAAGRAVDNGGKGGALTAGTNAVAGGLQSFADAPAQLQRLAIEAGAVATIFAGMKGAEALMGGFGLKGAAVDLTSAAEALKGAAVVSKGEGAAEAAAGLGGGRARAMSRLGKVMKSVPLIATAAIAAEEGIGALGDYRKANPGLFHGGARAAHAYGDDATAPTFTLGRFGTDEIAPSGRWTQEVGRNKGYTRQWVDETPHPALAPISDKAGTLPTLAGLGGLKATVEQPVPVDVTGKVQLEGQASVSVTVKVDGPGKVEGQSASSSGNIKVSTGASMPGAKSPTGGATLSGH